MKLEYLSGPEPDLPLIRLFEYTTAEVQRLQSAARQLADGNLEQFAVHEQEWVQPIAGCELLWRVTADDIGVKLPDSGRAFTLDFSTSAWRNVEDILRPFVAGSSGYNWLTDGGDVEVLVSPNGRW